MIVPHRIVFGNGSARNVRDEARTLGAKSILLVAGSHIVKSAVLTGIMRSLRARGSKVHIFSEVEPEPSIETADHVAEKVRERRFDLVCGVGGGSVMDIAKIASMMATNTGKVRKYLGVDLINRPGLPKILVPTTAGTGSEMTPNAIIGTHDGTKAAIISNYAMAETAIVDPMLTLSLPPRHTASSGVDALTHAVESHISLDANPITDLLSLRAVELIARYLPTVFSKPGDVEARSAMALASMMAGISIANAGTCSGHAAAYGYAGKYKIPHGFSVGIALPYILEFSLASCQRKAEAIAEALGERAPHLGSADAARQTVIAIVRLMKRVECPMSLSQMDIPREDIGSIARGMLKMTRLLVHNPRPIDESDAVRIVTRMWEGTLDCGQPTKPLDAGG